jgi:hypothetical protein
MQRRQRKYTRAEKWEIRALILFPLIALSLLGPVILTSIAFHQFEYHVDRYNKYVHVDKSDEIHVARYVQETNDSLVTFQNCVGLLYTAIKVLIR